MNSASPQIRYSAFISYSHADSAHAGWLHRVLETFQVPEGLTNTSNIIRRSGRRLAPVFRDREELSSSHDLTASIQAALESSDSLIVICSPNAAKSHWVNEEIKAFRSLHSEKRIFALIVDGEDSGPTPIFPPALLQKFDSNGALLDEVAEPLAADIRPGKDGKGQAKLKILAGLLQIPLDSLAQRDAARERKRMMFVTSMSCVGMALFAGIAFLAIQAEKKAEHMQRVSEREALTSKRTADFMIDLFSVADPGEARGKEITAKEILDRGVSRIDNGLDGEPAVQANLLHTMGRVYTGLGLYREAADLLEKANSRREEGATDWKDIFRTEVAQGVARYELGDFDTAYEILTKMVADAEQKIQQGVWDTAFSDAFTTLAHVEIRRENLDAAEHFFERTLVTLATQKQTNSQAYAAGVRGLATVMLYRGNYDASLEKLKLSDEIYTKINGEDHFPRFQILNDIASVIYFKGSPIEATPFFAEALRLAELNLGDQHPETASALNNLGRMKLETGEIETAFEYLIRAISIRRNLENDHHIDFAFYLNSLGVIEIERKNYDEAKRVLNEALKLTEPTNARLYGQTAINLGRVYCLTGDVAKGSDFAERGQHAMKSHHAEGNWRYFVALETISICDARGGNLNEALGRSDQGRKGLQSTLGKSHFFTKRAVKTHAAITLKSN